MLTFTDADSSEDRSFAKLCVTLCGRAFEPSSPKGLHRSQQHVKITVRVNLTGSSHEAWQQASACAALPAPLLCLLPGCDRSAQRTHFGLERHELDLLLLDPLPMCLELRIAPRPAPSRAVTALGLRPLTIALIAALAIEIVASPGLALALV